MLGRLLYGTMLGLFQIDGQNFVKIVVKDVPHIVGWVTVSVVFYLFFLVQIVILICG